MPSRPCLCVPFGELSCETVLRLTVELVDLNQFHYQNTIECCRGFEDMKDKISSSLKASYIFWLFFFTECATFGLKI